jgi:hypothetical protein
MATISVSSPKDAPKPRRKSIGTPMTSATSAPLSPWERARAKNSSWSAGRQPAREAVEEHGDARRLGQRSQLPSPRPQ